MRPIPLAEFEEIVRLAVSELPEQFLTRLENVDVVVEDWPTEEQLARHGLRRGETLYGLYEGVPLPERHGYGFVMPDKISVFKGPLEEACDSVEELGDMVRETVVHEFAHFFGISDAELDAWGLG